MRKKEKINWGLLAFVFGFCWCLKLGMHLDLKERSYPNDLNAYQEKMRLPRSGCGMEMLHYNNSIPNNGILEFRNLDGDIRRL
jgi:hypothetical protein